MRVILSNLKDKYLVLLCLGVVAAYAVFMRCVHLLDPDHYYILSADSHFFHWQAERLLSGDSIPMTWHSGLTYPLVWLAKAISFVSSMAPEDALILAGKLIPPILGVVSVVVVYLAASRMYNRRVGLWSAFGWAALSYACFVQAAGYLDRDGLSILLLMTGVFVFYFSREWSFSIAGRDVGWAAGALAVLAIEGLLVLEWLWLGAILLLAILTGFVIVEVAVDVLLHLIQTPTEGRPATASAKDYMTGAIAAVRRSSWRPPVLILGVSLVVGAVKPGIPSMYAMAATLVRDMVSGATGVSELQPMTAEDLFSYGFLIIPILIGLYVMVTRHSRGDVLCLGWFASLFVLGLFANRMFIYAAPAISVICGVGLASLFSFERARKSALHIATDMGILTLPSPRVLRMCAAMLVLLLSLLGSTIWAYHLGTGRMTAADNEWQEALAHLKENTPQDSVVMSWWDSGYWILDMADRKPVVDNGYYGWDQQRLEDVGLAYCTSDPSEAARIMDKYGADYLVFSRGEVAILSAISEYGLGEAYGNGGSVPKELKNSLYNQSLYGDFESGGELTRVYPSPEVKDPEVVILMLEK